MTLVDVGIKQDIELLNHLGCELFRTSGNNQCLLNNYNEQQFDPSCSNIGKGSKYFITETDNTVCKRKRSDDNEICIVEEYTSAREFCIYVLKMSGKFEDVNLSDDCPSSLESSVCMSCKICNETENNNKMLICDVCEEAFHVSCCKLKAKELPTDNWCCKHCLRTSKIPRMLKDNQLYVSRVGIGEDFQAEVPEWTGPVLEDHSYYFNEPMELNINECAAIKNVEKSEKLFEYSCNWIQCRIVRCGKWRRAPLFVSQTKNWDCSCCVLWDPIHADCAVPQELETDVILEQLKFLNCPSLSQVRHDLLSPSMFSSTYKENPFNSRIRSCVMEKQSKIKRELMLLENQKCN